MAKIIYVKKKDAPKDFQSWYLTEARSVVKKISEDIYAYEIDKLHNNIYIGMCERFPNIKHFIVNEDETVTEMN